MIASRTRHIVLIKLSATCTKKKRTGAETSFYSIAMHCIKSNVVQLVDVEMRACTRSR